MNTLREVAEAGNLAGLYDGLALCVKWYECKESVEGDDFAATARDQAGVEIPRWMLRNTWMYMRNELIAKTSCPTQKWLRRWERDMKLFVSLDAIEQARAHGAKWTDGEVYTATSKNLLVHLTPTQIEGRAKRARKIQKSDAKRFYSPMYLRVRDNL